MIPLFKKDIIKIKSVQRNFTCFVCNVCLLVLLMINRPEPSIIEPDAVVDVDTTPKPSTAAPPQQAQVLLLQIGK